MCISMCMHVAVYRYNHTQNEPCVCSALEDRELLILACRFSNIQRTSFHICPRFYKKVKESTTQPWILCWFFHENRSSLKVFGRIGTDGSLILILLGQRTRTSDSLEIQRPTQHFWPSLLIKPVARGRRARVNIITNLNICRS
jgi:hypothetical protein